MADHVAKNMRAADRQEILDSTGQDPYSALMRSYENSDDCWTGLLDNEPFVCFGAIRLRLLGNTGSVWLLGTPIMEKATIAIGRKSRYYIQRMLQRFSMLENYVSCENTVSIKWLGWCGAKLAAPVPFGVSRKPFQHFSLCATP